VIFRAKSAQWNFCSIAEDLSPLIEDYVHGALSNHVQCELIPHRIKVSNRAAEDCAFSGGRSWQIGQSARWAFSRYSWSKLGLSMDCGYVEEDHAPQRNRKDRFSHRGALPVIQTFILMTWNAFRVACDSLS
jgi:hypothetical protein